MADCELCTWETCRYARALKDAMDLWMEDQLLRIGLEKFAHQKVQECGTLQNQLERAFEMIERLRHDGWTLGPASSAEEE